MECTINKEALGISSTVFDGSVEQSIDLDFNLPDYCPDIQKILKCQIYPKITNRNLIGEQLNVDGIASVRLMYLDEEKKSIKYCEHASPFSSVFNLKEHIENPIINVKTKIEYVNCRAISPRRLDIHGAFSVNAKIHKKENKNISCDIECDSIEQKKSSINISNLVGIDQQIFSINETIELTNSTPPIESIIRSDVVIKIKDYRTITNKLIVNADALLNIFYISDIESGKNYTAHYNIPISQIVDIEGIEDNSQCSISIDVLNHDMQAKLDGNGNNNLLSLDMKIIISALAYENKEINILTDAYSTEYEVESSNENINLLKLFEKIETQYTSKNTIEFNSSNISDIIDIWCEQSNIEQSIHDDNIIFKIKLNICALVINDAEEPVYSEKVIEIEYNYPWEEKTTEIIIESNLSVIGIDSKIINYQTIEIEPILKINADIYTNVKFNVISSLIINEEKPIEKDTSAALTVYFANEGEEIWNIAREYNTSVNKIKSENELDSDFINTKKMLLIPM